MHHTITHMFIRAHIIDELLVMSDRQLFRRSWGQHDGCSGDLNHSQFSSYYLEYDSSKEDNFGLGMFLRTEAECVALEEVRVAWESLNWDGWKGYDDYDFFAAQPGWPLVMSKAKAAYLLLCKNNKSARGHWLSNG